MKLFKQLKKTSSQLSQGITGIFTGRKLDQAALDELEELLIMADLGAQSAATLVERFSKQRFQKEVTPEEVRKVLADEIAQMLEPYAKPPVFDETCKPNVILVAGVNGNGKTTTIGKLCHHYRSQGKTVMLAACDTFRAAAVSQLSVWAERADCLIITGAANADPASVAFKALEEAQKTKTDLLLIDTAGRLQNNQALMEELAKITRALKKLEPSAPHHTFLVLDATTGQNAKNQLAEFKEKIDVTGLIITKLDGTAKAGMAVALTRQFHLPVHYIGVGEGLEDLQSFDSRQFSEALLGIS